MKNKLLTAMGAFVLMATLGHFYAVPLIAQVRAAFTKNIDERGRNPYLQTVSCLTNTSNECTVSFPAVPANKRLVVEHVNVAVETVTPLSNVALSGNSFTSLFPFLQLQSQGGPVGFFYIANQPLLTYYEAGQSPQLDVAANAGTSETVASSATLSGYLVDLTM